MSRLRYDAAFGVLPLEWEQGAPRDDTYGLVLVELWRAETKIHAHEPTKPRVRVTAQAEVRVRIGGKWMAIDPVHGTPREPMTGEIRRHARLASSRRWNATIALEGWN